MIRSLLVCAVGVVICAPVRAAGAQQGRPAPALVAAPDDGPSDAAGGDAARRDALVRRDEAHALEVTLPAPWWEFVGRQALEQQARGGGCGGGSLPPEVLWAVGHKDALCTVRCRREYDGFLMRDQDGLKGFMDARIDAIRKGAGKEAEEMTGIDQAGWSQRGGMWVHRFALEVSAAGDKRIVQLYVHHFLRPGEGDGNAVLFALNCLASRQAFDELQPELATILGSFRYTGSAAEEFFVPDAPEEKLLTTGDADRGLTQPRRFTWIYPALIVLVVWAILRRPRTKRSA